ncbi:MAG TPA: DNA polymerase III subunit delta, partial [Dehalococcoidia bacterium]|nr:DNA polymerase III subunit delta [Dehalococcoidia bacterium]
MLYVFHGDDEFRAHEALRELRSQLDRDGNLAHNTVRIDEQDVRSLTPAALRAACHTASFFEETRLVIVEGLLKRLSGGGRRRGRRGRGAPEGGPISEADEFIDVLSTLPESTTVVLLDENATSMLEALPEGAAIRQFAKFRKADEVRPWAAQRAKTAGANFASGAFERLLTLVDAGHTGELASEIDKLATYAAEQPISIEDVDELVSSARNFMYWDLTDAVIDGRADRALGVLRRMDAKDQPAPYLSYMLVRQYRQILLAQSLLREGLSQQQIGAQMGLRDYPLRKAIEQASRYPADALEAAYRRLLENDVAVKTGVMEADAALEVLVVALAELARSPRRA